MTLKKVTFGVFAGIISLVIEGLSTITTAALLMKFLDSKIAGLWLLCLSFIPLLSLAQAGLGPTIIRRVSASVSRNQVEQNTEIELAKKAFDVITGFVVIIYGIVYIFYYADASINILTKNESQLSYIFFIIGLIIRVMALRRFQILIGYGHIGWDKLALSAGTLTTLISIYLSLSNGGGIIQIGMAFAIGSVVFYIIAYILYTKAIKHNQQYSKHTVTLKHTGSVFRESYGLTILTLVSLIVVNSDVWVVERLFGISVLPAYITQTKMVLLVSAVAGLVQQMLYPYIANAFSNNRIDELKELYWKGIAASWALGICGFILIALIAPYLMTLLIGSNSFLGWNVLILQIIFGLVYVNHIAFSYPVFAMGKNPFMMASVINATLSLPLSIALGYKLGLEGVLLGNILGTLIPSIWVVLKSKELYSMKNHV